MAATVAIVGASANEGVIPGAGAESIAGESIAEPEGIVRIDPRADVVELTAALVDIPSVSHQEAVLADAVQAALSACRHLTVYRLGNTVVAATSLGRSQRVLIGGHLDTVPPSGNDRAILVEPGDPVPVIGLDGIEVSPDQRLYGLGSCDMKGGVAVALRCAALVTEPAMDVTYVFYDCEEVETEHNGLGKVVRQHPDWVSCDFAVLAEPSDAGVEAGCQGTLRVEVAASGRRAHSARSWLGENAVHRAGEILDRLNSYQPREVVIDGLTYREGLNAVLIRGGQATNVIPDEAVVTVNYRYAPSLGMADAEAHVREVFDGFDVTVTDHGPGALPGLELPAAQAFIAEVGAEPRPKFGWTDVARFAELGIPAVNYGPGSPSLAHTRDEHVPTSQLRECDEVMRAWLSG